MTPLRSAERAFFDACHIYDINTQAKRLALGETTVSKLRIIFMITSVILLLSVIAGPIYAQESGTSLSIQGSLSINGGKLEGVCCGGEYNGR